MELLIDPENIENIDNTIFALTLSCQIIQKDIEGLTKIVPFMLKMSEHKSKQIWQKIQPFFTFDEKQWFRNFIKSFLIQS